MKKIIILERYPPFDVQYLFWLEVPSERQSFYANSSATSSYKDASQAEIDAIKNGAVVEKSGFISFEASKTIPQILNELKSMYNDEQDNITNRNPWRSYGTYWDGISWTTGGVN